MVRLWLPITCFCVFPSIYSAFMLQPATLCRTMGVPKTGGVSIRMLSNDDGIQSVQLPRKSVVRMATGLLFSALGPRKAQAELYKDSEFALPEKAENPFPRTDECCSRNFFGPLSSDKQFGEVRFHSQHGLCWNPTFFTQHP